eukprot:scaffold68222_cov23-Tisochrysis_lutea.AAC.1
MPHTLSLPLLQAGGSTKSAFGVAPTYHTTTPTAAVPVHPHAAQKEKGHGILGGVCLRYTGRKPAWDTRPEPPYILPGHTAESIGVFMDAGIQDWLPGLAAENTGLKHFQDHAPVGPTYAGAYTPRVCVRFWVYRKDHDPEVCPEAGAGCAQGQQGQQPFAPGFQGWRCAHGGGGFACRAAPSEI